VTFCKIRN
jgi:hypothetical protein